MRSSGKRGYAALLAALLPALAAAQPDAEALARRQHCFACHAADVHAYAPSFGEIARRHGRGDVDVLARRIGSGGSGHLGEIPMPPAGTLGPPPSDAEAHLLASWILSQAPRGGHP